MSLLDDLLKDQKRQVRAVDPPARRPSGPRAEYDCVACGEHSKSLAAAERHADTTHHARFSMVIHRAT